MPSGQAPGGASSAACTEASHRWRETFSWKLWGDHEPVPRRLSALPATTEAHCQVQGAGWVSPVLLLVNAGLPLQGAMMRDVSEPARFNGVLST